MHDATGSYDLAFRLIPVLVAVCIVGAMVAMNRGRATYLRDVPVKPAPPGPHPPAPAGGIG